MKLPDFETDRLWLRPLREDDASDLHVAFSDPECMRWWFRPATASPGETAQVVREMLERDAGAWVFGTQGSTEVLGHVGFINNLEAGGHAGFGYGLRRSHWGRGYAPEAARRLLEWAFSDAAVARVELWIHRDNRQSIRVAEKLGCERRAEAYLNYAVGPTPSVIYGLTAQKWRDEPEPAPTHYSVIPVFEVADVRSAAAWWCEALGFHIEFIYGEPGTVARVTPDPPWTGRGAVQLTRSDPPASAGSVYIIVGPGIDDLAKRAAAAGARIRSPLGDRPWGMREIELEDPDGNRVRLASPC